MSIVMERVKSHSLYTELRSGLETLSRVQESSSLTDDETDIFRRIEQVYIFLESLLEKLDPVFVSMNILNTLRDIISRVSAQLNSFAGNRQPQYLTQADQSMDQVLQLMPLLVMPIASDDLDGLMASIVSFKRSIGQHNRHLSDELVELTRHKDELQNQIQDLQRKIAEERNRISEFLTHGQNILSGFQQQFSEAQEKRLNMFSEETMQRNNKFVDIEDKLRATYEDASDRLNEHFDNAIMSLETENVEFRETLSNEYKLATEELIRSSQDALSQIQSHKTYIEELVGLIANTGQAKGYQDVANNEQRAATMWQTITLVSMLAFAGFAIYTFIVDTSGSTFVWGNLGTHLFVTLAFGGLSGYAAKQASDHQKTARWNRRMQLELTSIDPYLASLEVSVRDKVKESLASKLFGRAEVATTTNTAEESEDPYSNYEGLLRLVVQLTEEVAKLRKS